MYFIDSHAHLYTEAFSNDQDEMIQSALAANVTKFVLPNIDLSTIDAMKSLQSRYPLNCFPTLGLHPCDVKPEFKNTLHEMEAQLTQFQIYGIGETGTDAYWDTTYWNEQIESFSIQIDWAKKLKKPIIIHSRNSLQENIDIIQKEQDGFLTGVFHCFGGDLMQARSIIDLGFMLGIGGTITYKKNPLKDIIPSIGLSHLVLETDSPYLSPEPLRGQRNTPANIPIVAEFLARTLNCTLEEVANATSQNAQNLFKI